MDEALATLAAEVAELSDAKPGSTRWHLWQAKSLGLSFLKKAQLSKFDRPEDVERLRRAFRRKGMEEGEQEVLLAAAKADAPAGPAP